MSVYLVPLQNTPQRFAIVLGVTEYILVSRWNAAPEGGWLIDLYDADSVPIVMNLPLVTGIDLLGQYTYLNLGGALFVYTDSAPGAVPTLSNLGGDANVYFVTL